MARIKTEAQLLRMLAQHLFEPRTTLNLDVEYTQSSTSSGRSNSQGRPLHSKRGQPGLYKMERGRVGENKLG